MPYWASADRSMFLRSLSPRKLTRLSPHGSPPEERHCTQHSTLAFELQKAAVEQKQVWIGLGIRQQPSPAGWSAAERKQACNLFLTRHENPSAVTKLRRFTVAISLSLWE